MKSFFTNLSINDLFLKVVGLVILFLSVAFLIFTVKSFHIWIPYSFLMFCMAVVANIVIFKELDKKTQRTIYQILILIACCSMVLFGIYLVGLIRAPDH